SFLPHHVYLRGFAPQTPLLAHSLAASRSLRSRALASLCSLAARSHRFARSAPRELVLVWRVRTIDVCTVLHPAAAGGRVQKLAVRSVWHSTVAAVTAGYVAVREDRRCHVSTRMTRAGTPAATTPPL